MENLSRVIQKQKRKKTHIEFSLFTKMPIIYIYIMRIIYIYIYIYIYIMPII